MGKGPSPFRLNTLKPLQVRSVEYPLLSEGAPSHQHAYIHAHMQPGIVCAGKAAALSVRAAQRSIKVPLPLFHM